jgi:NhaP-type Na+/H+ or K+/H+ antiporter
MPLHQMASPQAFGSTDKTISNQALIAIACQEKLSSFVTVDATIVASAFLTVFLTVLVAVLITKPVAQLCNH